VGTKNIHIAGSIPAITIFKMLARLATETRTPSPFANIPILMVNFMVDKMNDNSQTQRQWAIDQARAHYVYLGSIVPETIPKHERSSLEADFLSAQRSYYSLIGAAA
jgi:hypothetical protein